jgi:tRNA pseudouridine55 synthase
MNGGILNVLKPPGMTSHDVVDVMRTLVPQPSRVGHAGTLDPSAAGVLVVCVGPATKLIEYLIDCDKAYRAEATLGISTDSLDAEGRIVAEQDASAVTEDEVRNAVAELVGPQMMAPPMFSAARVDGRRLYDLARKGQTVERKARRVTVHSADLVSFSPGPRGTGLVDIRCSKGTYVRVLCAQLGERLGVGAHLSFLVRTAVGPHLLAEAFTLEELREAHDRGRLTACYVPPETALGHLPGLSALASDGRAFQQGTAVPCRTDVSGLVRVHDRSGHLLGIGEVAETPRGRMLQPRKVLASP